MCIVSLLYGGHCEGLQDVHKLSLSWLRSLLWPTFKFLFIIVYIWNGRVRQFLEEVGIKGLTQGPNGEITLPTLVAEPEKALTQYKRDLLGYCANLLCRCAGLYGVKDPWRPCIDWSAMARFWFHSIMCSPFQFVNCLQNVYIIFNTLL